MSDFLEEIATRKRHSLAGPSITIGRDASCTIVIDDASVSRHHCSLTLGPSGWTVRDEGSRNGTAAAGKVLGPNESTALAVDGRLLVGAIELALRSSNEATRLHTREFSLEQLLPPAGADRSHALLNQVMFKSQAALFPGQPIDTLLEALLDLVLSFARASRASVHLCNADTAALEPGSTKSRSQDDRAPFVMSSGVSDKVMRERKTVLVRDVTLDGELKARNSLVMSGVTSAVAAPLFDGNDILGVLYADLRDPAQQLDDTDATVIGVLAAMAGTSLVAAQMISALMRSESQLREENAALRARLPGNEEAGR